MGMRRDDLDVREPEVLHALKAERDKIKINPASLIYSLRLGLVLFRPASHYSVFSGVL